MHCSIELNVYFDSLSLSLTFDVRHDEHLWLRQPLLEVVEVDGAVEGDEAHLSARVAGEPAAQSTRAVNTRDTNNREKPSQPRGRGTL